MYATVDYGIWSNINISNISFSCLFSSRTVSKVAIGGVAVYLTVDYGIWSNINI